MSSPEADDISTCSEINDSFIEEADFCLNKSNSKKRFSYSKEFTEIKFYPTPFRKELWKLEKEKMEIQKNNRNIHGNNSSSDEDEDEAYALRRNDKIEKSEKPRTMLKRKKLSILENTEENAYSNYFQKKYSCEYEYELHSKKESLIKSLRKYSLDTLDAKLSLEIELIKRNILELEKMYRIQKINSNSKRKDVKFKDSKKIRILDNKNEDENNKANIKNCSTTSFSSAKNKDEKHFVSTILQKLIEKKSKTSNILKKNETKKGGADLKKI